VLRPPRARFDQRHDRFDRSCERPHASALAGQPRLLHRRHARTFGSIRRGWSHRSARWSRGCGSQSRHSADAANALARARDETSSRCFDDALDIQAAECPLSSPPPVTPLANGPRRQGQRLYAVADMLAASQRPIFIAGRGANELRSARRHRAPGLTSRARCWRTSAVAAGLFAGKPRGPVGISGGFRISRCGQADRRLRSDHFVRRLS